MNNNKLFKKIKIKNLFIINSIIKIFNFRFIDIHEKFFKIFFFKSLYMSKRF